MCFIFNCIQQNGLPIGLNLSKDKCEMMFGINGANPFPLLPPALATELILTSSTYCHQQFNLDGLKILGVPIGGPTYIQTNLTSFTQNYNDIALTLNNKLRSPASKLQRYLQRL
jgi:hypothetical protein